MRHHHWNGTGDAGSTVKIYTMSDCTNQVGSGTVSGGGTFGIVLSTALLSDAQSTLYAAAKAAVAFYLRSLEHEVRSQGVRVAIVWDQRATLHRGTPWNYDEERTLASFVSSAVEADGIESVRVH